MLKTQEKENIWTEVITPKSNQYYLNLRELLGFKDLIALFVRRDFVAEYKQTILGPLWFVIKPIITTLIFVKVFNDMGKIPTNGIPPYLFYLSGLVMWKYFEDCVKKTSDTFINNSGIFGKVYFPRLTVPVSVVISNLITFSIQLLVFLGFFFFFLLFKNIVFDIRWASILLLPILVIVMASLGLGVGIIVSALTTKYRDLRHAVDFVIQLAMFASPVIFPLTKVGEADSYIKFLIYGNPMTGVIETFRFIFFGGSTLFIPHLIYSIIFALVVFTVGTLIFNKVEKTFMDTI